MPYRVSNSFRRGTLRTYSRQTHRVVAAASTSASLADFGDDENLQRRKRVRMDERGQVVEEEVLVPGCASSGRGMGTSSGEMILPSSSTVPSSPLRSEHALFSDNTPYDAGSMSPLSSPPPAFSPSPPPPTRKPAFSFLKRKRLSYGNPSGPPSEPLAEVAHNVVKTRRQGAKRSLTQMQIDLGGELRRSCKTCGMEFIPSNKEDTALHDEFCAIGLQGVDVGHALFKDKTIRRLRTTQESRSMKEFVVIVDHRSSAGARKQARKVLEIVNIELSASEIRDEELWGVPRSALAHSKRHKMKKRKANVEEPEMHEERFKIFMYLIDAKCAGFCLAEKISAAHRVVASEGQEGQQQNLTLPSKSSSISISAEADVALVGISRIWTSRTYRNQGIASMLLDCVRGNFFYGMEVPKDLVAFSQPTESGGQLAEHWFEAKNGWHVYTEERS